MKAVSYTRHGIAAEVLELGDLPDPIAGDGEVLVRLVASGVNPSDVKARAGYLWPMTAPRTIPHSDGAGVIVAVGGGVDKARIGERVPDEDRACGLLPWLRLRIGRDQERWSRIGLQWYHALPVVQEHVQQVVQTQGQGRRVLTCKR